MADATATATTTSTTTADAPPTKKHAVNLQEVQETVSRLASHKGVIAVLILNSKGDIVTQSGASGGGDSMIGNPKLLSKMLQAANTYVLSMPNSNKNDIINNNNNQQQQPQEESDTNNNNDDGNEDTIIPDRKSSTTTEENISFVRIRTPRDEILVAPKLGYTLVVLQDPSVSSL
jgi:hypothetical protein